MKEANDDYYDSRRYILNYVEQDENYQNYSNIKNLKNELALNYNKSGNTLFT